MKRLAHISPGLGLVLQNHLGPALRKQGLVDRSGPPPTPRDAEPVAEFGAVDVPKGFCLSGYLDFSCVLEELPDAVNSVETNLSGNAETAVCLSSSLRRSPTAFYGT